MPTTRGTSERNDTSGHRRTTRSGLVVDTSTNKSLSGKLQVKEGNREGKSTSDTEGKRTVDRKRKNNDKEVTVEPISPKKRKTEERTGGKPSGAANEKTSPTQIKHEQEKHESDVHGRRSQTTANEMPRKEKSKAAEDEIQTTVLHKAIKKSSKSTIDEISSTFSPRRSGRGLVPNRKFQDMEVDFTPLKIKEEPEDSEYQEKTTTENKQKKRVSVNKKSAKEESSKPESHSSYKRAEVQEYGTPESRTIKYGRERNTSSSSSSPLKQMPDSITRLKEVPSPLKEQGEQKNDNSRPRNLSQVNMSNEDDIEESSKSALKEVESNQDPDKDTDETSILLNPETGLFVLASTGEVISAGNLQSRQAEGAENNADEVAESGLSSSGVRANEHDEGNLRSESEAIAEAVKSIDESLGTVDSEMGSYDTVKETETKDSNKEDGTFHLVTDDDNQSEEEVKAAMQSLMENVNDGTVIELVGWDNENGDVDESITNLAKLVTPGGKRYVVKGESQDSVLVIKEGSETPGIQDKDITVIHLEETSKQGTKQGRILPAGVSKTQDTQTQTPYSMPDSKGAKSSEVADKIKSLTLTKQSSTSQDGGSAPETVRKEQIVIVQLPAGQTVQRRFVKEESESECHVPFTIDENGDHVCGLCTYKTSKKANWYKHKKKHSGQRFHKCPLCDYTCATSSNLKRHVNIHKDVREHKCPCCTMTFRQKIHLERHIKYKHEEKQVQCPLCDYTCANENPDLKVHIKRRHLPPDSTDGTLRAFKCEHCDMMTMNKKDLRQHMKFHKNGPELKLFCEHCSFVTDCESRLKRHMLTHTGERPFQCGLCDYRASQKDHVLRHMKSQHNIDVERRGRKNMEELSEDSESRDSTSKVGKQDFTSQEKIFACNHCSMKFSKLLNLYKHLHTQHKDILPSDNAEYMCVVCDFRTLSKKNLLVHMRRHNMHDQLPPSHVFSCVLCHYMNPKRRNLFQHMKKKHGIEIVVKNDGSASCFVSDLPATVSGEGTQNELTVGDNITTGSEESPLQIVTADKSGSNENIISLEDLAYAMSHPKPFTSGGNLVIDESRDSGPSSSAETSLEVNDAAEAIKGLQALAEQPGISLRVSNPDNPQTVSLQQENEKSDNTLCTTETEVITMDTTEGMENPATSEQEDIQLSQEQIMHLSAGDFVEINGEMYQVEISQEGQEQQTLDSTVEEITTVENVIPCTSGVGEIMQTVLGQDGSD